LENVLGSFENVSSQNSRGTSYPVKQNISTQCIYNWYCQLCRLLIRCCYKWSSTTETKWAVQSREGSTAVTN